VVAYIRSDGPTSRNKGIILKAVCIVGEVNH
jgi:hypothetical protein